MLRVGSRLLIDGAIRRVRSVSVMPLIYFRDAEHLLDLVFVNLIDTVLRGGCKVIVIIITLSGRASQPSIGLCEVVG